MLEKLSTGAKIITGSLGSAVRLLHWVDAWEAAYYNATDNYGARKIFRDGTTIAFTATITEQYVCALAGGGPVKRTTSSPYKIYALNPFTGLFALEELLSFTTVLTNRDFIDPDRNLILRRAGALGNQINAYNLTGAVLWTQIVSQAFDCIHWVRDRQVALLGFANGSVQIFDYVARETLMNSKIDPCLLSCYDHTRHTILAIQANGTTRGWHPTPVPAQFGAVTATPAPAQFTGSRLSVQLQGDVGEPCPNWWVKWRLENDKGSLEKPQSKTDAQGYAYNYWFGPETVLGAEKVICEVEV
jgi:hypothetical protein